MEEGKLVTGEELYGMWKQLRQRDAAVLAGLHVRIDAIISEGVAEILRVGREQRAEELLSLLQSMNEKVRDLQRLQPDSPIAQGLLADLRSLLEVIGRMP